MSDGKIRVLVNLVGGAGSDNVPNWAPDGTHLAFVSFPDAAGGTGRIGPIMIGDRSEADHSMWDPDAGTACAQSGRQLNSSGAVTLGNRGHGRRAGACLILQRRPD